MENLLRDIFGSSDEEEEFLGFSNEELLAQSDIDVSEISDSSSSESDVDESPDQNFSHTLSRVAISEFSRREPIGPTNVLAREKNELDFLDLFFPLQIFEILAVQTNLYAFQKSQGAQDLLWTETSSAELRTYFGIPMFMAIVNMPDMKMYWSNDIVFGGSPISNIMPRNRFEKLSQFIHANDRSKMPGKEDINYDKLYLVRPILDIVRRRCLENYNAHMECAIDEAMVAFRGRLDIRQYLPSKPTKYGIKIWMQADSHNGYCNDFSVYLGKPKDGNRQMGLGRKVVEDLTECLNGTFTHVYCDNYFCSPALCKSLLEKGLYCCGTVRSNNKGLPDEIRSKKKLNALVKNGGDSEQFQKDEILVSVWREKKGRKPVLMVSTNSNPVQGPTFINRRQKDGSIKEVPSVVPVLMYNEFMNAVDHSDQLRTLYPTARSTKPWWLYIMWFLFDISLANAFICFKESPNHTRINKNGKEATVMC